MISYDYKPKCEADEVFLRIAETYSISDESFGLLTIVGLGRARREIANFPYSKRLPEGKINFRKMPLLYRVFDQFLPQNGNRIYQVFEYSVRFSLTSSTRFSIYEYGVPMDQNQMRWHLITKLIDSNKMSFERIIRRVRQEFDRDWGKDMPPILSYMLKHMYSCQSFWDYYSINFREIKCALDEIDEE